LLLSSQARRRESGASWQDGGATSAGTDEDALQQELRAAKAGAPAVFARSRNAIKNVMKRNIKSFM
jgi:hypothetical protein